jgi:hypothetical protein
VSNSTIQESAGRTRFQMSYKRCSGHTYSAHGLRAQAMCRARRAADLGVMCKIMKTVHIRKIS